MIRRYFVPGLLTLGVENLTGGRSLYDRMSFWTRLAVC